MNLGYLQQAISPAREKIIHHPVYNELKRLQDLQIFCAHHVFAVWDFMSLLKRLQQELTCVNIPWQPKGSATTRYLINEIVLGEESDIDPNGTHTSHFELYLRAMQNMHADIAPIKLLLADLKSGLSVESALENGSIPESVRSFCSHTFKLVNEAPPHVLASVFTFGREDLIPDMFHELVSSLSSSYPEEVALFQYYLERHIEVDGDHHSILALQMVEELCGTDKEKWEDATTAALEALEQRRVLWDCILKAIQENHVYSSPLSV